MHSGVELHLTRHLHHDARQRLCIMDQDFPPGGLHLGANGRVLFRNCYPPMPVRPPVAHIGASWSEVLTKCDVDWRTKLALLPRKNLKVFNLGLQRSDRA